MTNELPEVEAVLDAPGTACAYLTPLIKEHLTPLASGEVLEVLSDDPAAREGVPAWSRLTGNDLVASVMDGERNTRFFLRKK
jgi:TusA-related sulfurtransferase